MHALQAPHYVPVVSLPDALCNLSILGHYSGHAEEDGGPAACNFIGHHLQVVNE